MKPFSFSSILFFRFSHVTVATLHASSSCVFTFNSIYLGSMTSWLWVKQVLRFLVKIRRISECQINLTIIKKISQFFCRDALSFTEYDKTTKLIAKANLIIWNLFSAKVRSRNLNSLPTLYQKRSLDGSGCCCWRRRLTRKVLFNKHDCVLLLRLTSIRVA